MQVLDVSQLKRLRRYLMLLALPLLIATFWTLRAARSLHPVTELVSYTVDPSIAPAQPTVTNQPVAVAATVAPKPATPPAKATAKTPPKPSAPAPAIPTYQQNMGRLQALSQQFGVDISVLPPAVDPSDSGTWTRVNSADNTNLNTFLIYLEPALAKYPMAFFQKVNLKHIYLVTELVVDGQTRAGMPEPMYDHALYFDIGGEYLSASYTPIVIHHEFDHLIEFTEFGSYDWNDTAWLACNPTGFHYGSGGASAHDEPGFTNTLHAKTGFVSNYSTYGIEEDKAELFAELFVQPSAVNGFIQNDSNLACKVALYRGYMAAIGLTI